MVRRLSIVFVFVAFVPGFVRTASAQERIDFTGVDFTAAVLSNAALSAVTLPDIQQLPAPVPAVSLKRGSSALLNSLYASTAVMQALDVHSTLRAFKAGATEGNPLMSGITRNRGAFLAVKAAVATTTILATRQIAKRNKVAAVVSLVAINSAYAMIVRHNYNVARGR